jgi:Cu-Zn family superoxide dismutase
MSFHPFTAAAGALAIAALLGGCMSPGGTSTDTPATMPLLASATLAPTKGNTAAGTVGFYRSDDHLIAQIKITGLVPGRTHGFHVHEKGDCSSPDAESAGGHYNPTSQPHGPQDAAHHAGDLPALTADASGVASTRVHLRGVSIGAGGTDLTGRALVVHANPDDYKTQPTGNSGARIACGVIEARR